MSAATVKPLSAAASADVDVKVTASATPTAGNTAAATASSAAGAATAFSASAAATPKATRMRLDHITFTGADDKSAPSALLQFLSHFHNASPGSAGPRVEIGFLVSRPDFGTPKYPSHAWIAAFATALNDACAAADKAQPNTGAGAALRRLFSVHVCNDWAAELAENGSTECFEKVSVLSDAKSPVVTRVQLNFSRSLAAKKLVPSKLLAALVKYPKIEFIFQLPSFEHYDLVLAARAMGIAAYGFFDPSAGMGISPKHGWPQPPKDCGTFSPAGTVGATGDARLPVGYAGGLGPNNLSAALEEMTAHGVTCPGASGQPFWVDMETNVRTNNEFDLQKVAFCIGLSKQHF